MRKKNLFDDDLQLSLNLWDNKNAETEASDTDGLNNLLCIAKTDEILEQIDTLFQRIGKIKQQWFIPRLSAFVLNSFYVKGLSLDEIATLMEKGVKDFRPVSRERARMIIYEIRDEFLNINYEKKHTKGIEIPETLVQLIREFSKRNIGHVINREKWQSCPRLNAIAFLLRKRVVNSDTVIPWIKKEIILLDDKVEKRLFNRHYLPLFHMLQKEVLPMSFEQITRLVASQRQLKGKEVNESLVRLILSHDEVFEETENKSYQLRFEHLNVTQKIARIIFEEKDICATDIQRIYHKHTGENFSGLSFLGKTYPWCVPIGKSKWVFRENGKRELMPEEIIRNFCNEHIRFSFDDVKNHLQSHGININESSIRSYIMKSCRTRNSDGNQFCLTSHITEEENHLWRVKSAYTTRRRNVQWRGEVIEKIGQILESAPNHTVLQKDILHKCLPIFERYEIAYNNFYKILSTSSSFRKIEIEGKTYLTTLMVSSINSPFKRKD